MIPLIYHNLTEILHGGEGWLWYEQLSPAGPITVQWGSGLNCMLAKQNVLLVNSRHELYHSLFRIPCLYLPNDTGFIHKWQTWHVTVWIMVIMIIVINVRAKKKTLLKLWDDTCRCELGTEDWAVHRVILSNEYIHWWIFGTLQKGLPAHSWSCHSSHWNCTPMILGSWESWITRLP